MTGMGQDGLRGCELIKQARGQVIVQDEASSIVWGMPGYVAKAGLADSILPLTEIADEIARRVHAAAADRCRLCSRSRAATRRKEAIMGLEAQEFEYLRQFLAHHSAVILDEGKGYLAESRLTPLAYREGMDSVQELLAQIRKTSFNELHRKVLDAMMNNETWFFRDHLPFEALRRAIIPELMADRAATRRLNFWSAASSSGQEAYSIAMPIKEEFGGLARLDHLDRWNRSIFGDPAACPLRPLQSA